MRRKDIKPGVHYAVRTDGFGIRSTGPGDAWLTRWTPVADQNFPPKVMGAKVTEDGTELTEWIPVSARWVVCTWEEHLAEITRREKRRADRRAENEARRRHVSRMVGDDVLLPTWARSDYTGQITYGEISLDRLEKMLEAAIEEARKDPR